MPSVTFTTRGALRKSALREANERLILSAVRQNPSISRPDLARITGLSASSISFIVNRLKQAHMILEEPVDNHARVGRRPTALRLAADAKTAIGVEVAITGSRVALVDLEGKKLREKVVPWHPNYEIVAQRLHAAVAAMLGRSAAGNVLGVGVGIPGSLESRTGRVIAAENLNWFNVEFGRLLRGRLALPFRFENNARVAALAERWFRTPGDRELHDFVFVMMSGGLGAGIITNGRLLEGFSGTAGEFGHISLHPEGRPCSCGSRGCLEEYASDRALLRYYAEESGGNSLPAAEAVLELAGGGDRAALAAVHRMARELALGLSNLVWIFNPEAVVVGGCAGEAWRLVEEPLWEVLRSRLPEYVRAALRVLPSKHTADAVLLGAASLVFSHFFTSFEHGSASGASRPVTISAGA